MPSDQENMEKLYPGLTVESMQHNQAVFSDIIAKYYGDPGFRERLDADPAGVLNAEGFRIPPGRTVKLVFNSDEVMNVVVPWIEPDASNPPLQD